MAAESVESSSPRAAVAESAPPREFDRLIAGFRRRHERRRRLFPRAILVGLLVGVVSSLFRAAVERGEDLRAALYAVLRPWGGLGLLLAMVLSAALVGLVVLAVRRWAPFTSGSGIPHLKAVLHRHRPLPGGSLVAVKFLGGAAAISSGLALGREGPTIQMGGALGGMVSRRLRSTAHEQQVMIAAGAGAGLAAAFNAPLAGLVFVLEEIQKNFAPGIFSAAFLASVTADTVSRVLFGQRAVLETVPIAAPPLAAVPFFALLGIAAGVLALLFNRGLLALLDGLEPLATRTRVAAGAAVGASAAALAWFRPAWVGAGGRLLENALAGRGVVAALLATLAVRYVLSLASYGTGAPGGIFAPLLVLGSQLGLALGVIAAALAPAMAGAPAAWAVVGMAALFSGIVRAPLTGIVLMLEMTESYSLMLPLLVASFTAQWVADWLREPPIYDALLERELRRSPLAHPPHGALMLELDVLPDAPYVGRTVAELSLPPGLLIVAFERQGQDHVATAATRLEAGDRLAVAVAPEAIESLGALRAGLGVEA